MKKFSLLCTLFCACFLCKDFLKEIEHLKFVNDHELYLYTTSKVHNEKYWELYGKSQAYDEIIEHIRNQAD